MHYRAIPPQGKPLHNTSLMELEIFLEGIEGWTIQVHCEAHGWNNTADPFCPVCYDKWSENVREGGPCGAPEDEMCEDCPECPEPGQGIPTDEMVADMMDYPVPDDELPF